MDFFQPGNLPKILKIFLRRTLTPKILKKFMDIYNKKVHSRDFFQNFWDFFALVNNTLETQKCRFSDGHIRKLGLVARFSPYRCC